MREVPIIGVDPGGKHTGIVVRTPAGLHRWSLITRTTPIDWYLGEVVDAVTEARDFARNLILADGPADLRTPVLAVEDLNDPTPQMGITSVRGLLDTAQVLGALAGHWVITRVPPGGHGSGVLAAYPPALRGDGETRGRGKLKHCRSAWDLAATARTLIRREASV